MFEPSSRSDGRLPIILLGGFLGAGKSTWLRHQLHCRRFGRTHVIVNEAAETPVDDLLLGGADRLTVLAGGCACCTGRGGLRDALLAICDGQSRTDADPIDCIVLETSGLADPAAVAAMLADDQLLCRWLVLERTIVMIDAICSGRQMQTESLARRQAEAADDLIVTKARETTAIELARLVATLRGFAPGADLRFCEYGVDHHFQIDASAAPYCLSDIATPPEPMQAHHLALAGRGDWASLSVWLSAMLFSQNDRIARVKGVITTPAGRLLLQSVRSLVQPPEILPWTTSTTEQHDQDFVVIIGRGIDQDRLIRSWRHFVQGIV